VPKSIAYCDDPSVTGAPFYIMEFVEGNILRDTTDAERFDVDFRRRASFSMIETLAQLHSLDVDEIGLGDLAKREGYIERQLKRWYGQFIKSQQSTGRSVPQVDVVHNLLSNRIPPQGPATIVHGDFRLDNTVLDDHGATAAVLDWEICTLGDPLADVGLLMVYWAEPGDPETALGVAPTIAGGFASRAELRGRYSELTRRDLSELDFYIAFGYWKLACILEGVYSRYNAGAPAGDRTDHELFARQVGVLATAAAETLAQMS